MSGTFLLELRSEEIPARMQAAARADLERLFRRELDGAGVTPGAITVWSTPRRLALIARDLPLASEPMREELKGPRTSAPAQAIEGFLRKTGLTADHLTERDGVWFAVVERPGRSTGALLAQAIPAIIRTFPWPKSMRWGADSLSSESLRWVRPLSGIIALLDGEVVPFAVDGIAAGRETVGHRFHHPGAITLAHADDYMARLRAAHVIVDHTEREGIVHDGARRAAADAGLVLVEDTALVRENAGLTEWPVPLLGRFDPAFLAVPPEVIQLTARINQKYFIATHPSRTAEGDHAQHGGGAVPQAPTLANAFICTANIAVRDGGRAIIDGNRKVLAARLADARFFWDQDRIVPLADQAQKLARITFHAQLGSLADKAARVADLAEWLVRKGVVPCATSPSPSGEGLGWGLSPGSALSGGPPPPAPPLKGRGDVAAQARLAAELCKADLVTQMVGEFPELQGIMGGHYARAQGLPDAVADAIRDHYKPVGQSDEVPTAPVSVAVALADKLDTLVGFFAIDEKPSGSKDPFALRRTAIGIVRLILDNRLPLSVRSLFNKVLEIYADQGHAFGNQNLLMADSCFVFLIDRLKVQQRELRVRPDLIDAVFALTRNPSGEANPLGLIDAWLAEARPDIVQDDNLVRLLARVHALQAFVGTDDGSNLLKGYKRAANILKKETWTALPHDYAPEPAEAALRAALTDVAPHVDRALVREDFTGAMAALAGLRAPIDRLFFEGVTVNDADANKRANRLGLLDQFRAAVHKVADFSQIEG